MKKGLDQFQCISFGLSKIIIHHDLVELICEGQLELCPCDALVDDFWCICSTTLESFAQFSNRWWLDKQTHGLVAIILLDIHATFHVDVEHHVLSSLKLTFLLAASMYTRSKTLDSTPDAPSSAIR